MDEKLRSRFEALKRYKKEYGGIDRIPELILEKIEYIRYEDEQTGDVQVLPAEVFAKRALVEQIRPKERDVFDEITFEVPASEGYFTSLAPAEVQDKLEKLFACLETRDAIPWANDSLREFSRQIIDIDIPIAVEDVRGEKYILSPANLDPIARGVASK